MRARCVPGGGEGTTLRRRGQAAVEFAVCLPLIVLILSGLWEVGRISQVQQVMWNSAREAARDASLGQDTLQTVATNLLTYLQSADQVAFPPTHTTSLIAPVVTLPANTTGYTCWDQTANREMFTITFTDATNSSTTDPTGMTQLDRFALGVQVPYRSIAASPLAQVTGSTRLSATVNWAAMVDSPFQITPSLPAQ
ncbi:MAG: TadE/TadG family type IV pilus assembly protein [Isosphaeraceae bacterium]|nr:TadE/TadG family type IV pilus assembly protein [Isosphaeraceae bacterium]